MRRVRVPPLRRPERPFIFGDQLADPTHPRRFIQAIDPMTPPAGLEGAVYAVGNFDGLHRGHKGVIERAQATAHRLGAAAALLTFEPHPADWFAGPGTVFRLTPLSLKARLAERLGMDGLVVLSFDADLANLSAEEFVSRILVERLGVAAIVAGYDFHFGKARRGTPAFLSAAGAEHGFSVEIIDKIDVDGAVQPASSTATRAALEAGDVARASALLGHFYSIMGTVLPGQRLGRTLGFPTANLQADPSCRLRHGIYAVRVAVDGQTFDGVASWGRRPTVDNGAPLLEVFLFDFAGDLYGKDMEVSFITWLRSEEKFASLDDMRLQMARDVDGARHALSSVIADSRRT